MKSKKKKKINFKGLSLKLIYNFFGRMSLHTRTLTRKYSSNIKTAPC